MRGRRPGRGGGQRACAAMSKAIEAHTHTTLLPLAAQVAQALTRQMAEEMTVHEHEVSSQPGLLHAAVCWCSTEHAAAGCCMLLRAAACRGRKDITRQAEPRWWEHHQLRPLLVL